MNIRLTIIGAPPSLSHVFGPEGGAFGRSQKCQWVLPDPDFILSSVHGRVSFSNGRYVLVDESTNGIFLDGRSEPLGRGNSVVLQDKLRFRAAKYVIEAQVVRVAQPDLQSSPWPDAPIPMAPMSGGNADEALRQRDEFGAPRGQSSQDPLAYLDGAGVPGGQPLSAPVASAFSAMSMPLPGQGAAQGGFPVPPVMGGAGRDGAGARGNDGGFDDLFAAPSAAPAMPMPPPVQPQQTMMQPVAPVMNAQPVIPATPPVGRGIPEDFLSSFGAPKGGMAMPSVQAPFAPQAQQLAPVAAAPAAAKRIPDGFDPLTSFGMPRAQVPVPAAPPVPVQPPLSPAFLADVVKLEPPGAPRATASVLSNEPFDPLEALKSRREERKAALMDKARGSAVPVPPFVPPPVVPSQAEMPVAPMAALPLPPAVAAPLPVAVAMGQASGDGALVSTLLAGMGLPAARISPDRGAELADDMGRMVRETAEGLVALLAARRMFKSEFRMDETQIQPEENNAFKHFKIAELALDEMLLTKSGGFQEPAEATAAAFQDLQQHVMLTMSAMQRAISLLFRRLSPDAVAREAEDEGGMRIRGLGARKGKWETYVENHARMSGNIDGIARQIIAEAFAQVQEEQARKAASAYWEGRQ